MKTTVDIDEKRFLINGQVTYEECDSCMHGLLMNSRMVQAIFDDECPETRDLWKYPDTGIWDPERNTDEFCDALSTYRDHGLLAVTVGLQGGGSIYSSPVYDKYCNSAFTSEGSLKASYFNRLERILKRCDELGMVVIVNYFYFKQVAKIPDDNVIRDITERTTERLLASGYRNILVDVANESASFWNRKLMEPQNIDQLIDIVQSITYDGRRLLVSASTGCGKSLPEGRWREIEDFSLPHGNGCTPDQLTEKLITLRETPEHRKTTSTYHGE
jgi:hypothetical protein